MRRPLRPTISSAPLMPPSKPRPSSPQSRAHWLLCGTRQRSAHLDGLEPEDEDHSERMPAAEAGTAGECVQADATGQGPTDAVAPERQDMTPASDPPDPVTHANLDRRIAQALLQDNHARLAMRRVAAHVADFCNAAPVRYGGLWEAQLDLREDVLPATRLWMRLSPGSLSLRFRCGTPLAQQLVCTGRQSLHAALDAVLHEPCDVDIEVA